MRRFHTSNIVVTGGYRVDSREGCKLKQSYFEYTIVMVEGLAVLFSWMKRLLHRRYIE